MVIIIFLKGEMRTPSQLFSTYLFKQNLIQTSISIYLAEAVLHCSQLASRDQSSLILEGMPASRSNLTFPHSTQTFPFYWAHRGLEMIFITRITLQKKKTPDFSLDSAVAVPGSIYYTLPAHHQVFTTSYSRSCQIELMQDSQWQTNSKTNNQLSCLRLYILLQQGTNSAKHNYWVPQRVVDTLVFLWMITQINKSKLTSQPHPA